MPTNLPAETTTDSAQGTKLFFDTYGKNPLEFNSVDVDTTVQFFQSKGFTEDSALTISTVLLKQAKLESISISVILEKIKSLNETSLSALVAEILNNNRPSTSTLGYRKDIGNANKQRNVVP